MKNYLFAFFVIAVVAGVFGLSRLGEPASQPASGAGEGPTVTVYKSPTCGCCVGYVAALKKAGYQVNVETTEDMAAVKTEHGIPRNMQSCHTSVIGDYVVEGHVPLVAVEKLLEEQPAVDGIALPGMPAGTPGMPGTKKAPYQIFQLTDGSPSHFMEL